MLKLVVIPYQFIFPRVRISVVSIYQVWLIALPVLPVHRMDYFVWMFTSHAVPISVSFLAELSVSSPRKLFIFII